MHLRALTLSLALAATASVLPSSARADLVVGVDAEAAVPVDLGETGYAVGGRVGWSLDLGPLRLAPELGAGQVSFGGESDEVGTTSGFRGFGGARLSLGSVVEPLVFVHAGWARVSTELEVGGVRSDAITAGAYLEAGGGVEFTLLPVLNLGVHASYSRLEEGPLRWIGAGLHVDLLL